MLPVLAPLRWLVPLFAALLQTAPPAPNGLPAMMPYRNDSLRLSYSVPANFTDASALALPAFQASLGQSSADAVAARCMTLPFSRMAVASQRLSLVLLVRADAECFHKKFDAKSVAELTEGEIKGISGSGLKASFGEVSRFVVAGRPAAALQGSFGLPTGQSMQARVVCVLDQPDIVCWQFLANDLASLLTLGSFPVTFDGSAAVPVSAAPPSPREAPSK